MLKKALLLSAALFVSHICGAQTTFIPLGSEDYNVLDRIETMSGRLCDTICLSDKGETRRTAITFIENLRNHINDTGMANASLRSRYNSIDRYNMDQMISENSEWTTDEEGAINSKKAWFNTFYKKQYDFIYKKGYFLFLVVNPVFNGTALVQQNSPATDPITHTTIPALRIGNSHGMEARGWISKKVGFYTMFTDNQEQLPYSVNNWAQKKYEAVPGADYFLKPKSQFGTYDYLQTSGYINFDLIHNHMNTTFGFGKNFIGDGISSLFLTDNSAGMPYLKIQTRIWNLNYECLYMELTPTYTKGGDQILVHKYSAMHYLTWNMTKSFMVGFFEAEVFDRTDGVELSYLNPIIVTTAINRFNGSGDKSLLGFNVKKIIGHHVQLYGQLAFNEFRISELTSSKGWYGNKWGIQAGAKYFDAFGIRNLDLQAELDMVRPYMYSAQDTIANYTNYNQPLADPLGSGFVKGIGVARYRPAKNFYITGQATYYVRGNDHDSLNYGNDIYKAYPTAVSQYGVKMINGVKSTCMIMSLNVSYQVRRNIFLDLGGTYRNFVSAGTYPISSTTGVAGGPQTTTYAYFGVRFNTTRRNYDFF
jgi:hypothetical protein